ncbi:hypothetical protein FQZ97_608630 [compost metagenome]
MNTSVGHSRTLNERPSGRPLPSSTLMRRTFGYLAKASAMFGCAALQMPHQLVPNSTTAGPWSASISLRSGCSVWYSEVMGRVLANSWEGAREGDGRATR